MRRLLAAAALGLASFLSLRALMAARLPQASPEVLTWWAFLCAASAANILLYLDLLREHRASTFGPEERRLRAQHLVLCGVYVAVCAFRSVFPRADVQRICLVDSWLSSVAVGRSAATIAELAYAAQWALILREAARATAAPWTALVARLVLPILFVAECFSWAGVLTTNFLYNAIENSLWGLTVLLCLTAALELRPRLEPARRKAASAVVAGAAAFILFIAFVDVPMYAHRYAEGADGPFLSLVRGLRDCWERRVVTFRLEDWDQERAWMALYFSTAVWLSLALARWPRLARVIHG